MTDTVNQIYEEILSLAFKGMHMYPGVAGFLIGVVSIQFFPVLPSLIVFLPCLILICLLGLIKRFPETCLYFISMCVLGCAWAIFFAHKMLAWELPEDVESKTLIVTGIVDSIPKINSGYIQFEYKIKTLNNHSQPEPKILLSWYKPQTDLIEVGDHWQFKVRLKRPHGLANPGGFDYEKLLLQKRIRATGYIVPDAQNKHLSRGTYEYSLAKLRSHLQKKIKTILSDTSVSALIVALIIGIQHDISPSQWELMRITGTNHLMAIAGVHIGFVAGFIYSLIYFLWKQSSRLLLWLPAKQAAALGSWFAAIFYGVLAGFSLPAQRAVIMLTVFVLSILSRRSISGWQVFFLALFLILIWDPLSTFSVSFWLSFGAVFIILYGMNDRIKAKEIWWKYGRMQWIITLGLIPLCLVLFQQTSLISFLANLFAVPAVGFLVLPFALSGTLFLWIYEPIAQWMLLFSAKSLTYILQALSWMTHIKHAVWQHTIGDLWILFFCVTGVLLLIAPRGLPARWLGLFGLFPLFYYSPSALKPGEVEFVLLDVGQGLSAFVRTQHHTLLFDTGPGIKETQDAGGRVILPFLYTQNITFLDKLIVSHGDNDHIGGAATILKSLPVRNILTSVPNRFNERNISICTKGQKWIFDDVIFEILYPPTDHLNKGNNSSCVLKISTGINTILLTGDIEKSAEDYLVYYSADALQSDILVAPHHGSRSSSTLKFIKAVQPKYVLFPVGYQNRYHFPNKLVLDRYKAQGAVPFDTAKDGAITFKLNSEEIIKIERYRETYKKFWR